MGRFHVAHFYRLHGEIVERWFSLQNLIFYGVEVFNSPFYKPRPDTSLQRYWDVAVQTLPSLSFGLLLLF